MTGLAGAKKTGFYLVLGVLTAFFLMAGGAKLSGQQANVETFARFHLPLWFMYVIGVVEVLGAMGLWIPRLSAIAAVGLIGVMLAAVAFHVLFDPLVMALPALLAAGLLGVVAKVMWRRACPQR